VSQFKKILEEYKEYSVDFVVVYIEEAHPTDEWWFESVNYKIKQAKELEERLSAAKMLLAMLMEHCRSVFILFMMGR